MTGTITEATKTPPYPKGLGLDSSRVTSAVVVAVVAAVVVVAVVAVAALVALVAVVAAVAAAFGGASGEVL